LGGLAQASVYPNLFECFQGDLNASPETSSSCSRAGGSRVKTVVLQRPLLQLFTILCVGLTQLPLAGLYSLALVKVNEPLGEA
jgi:hypothetical protein